MKTNLDIDERLLWRAKRLTGIKTTREVVRRAVELLVRLKEQEQIRLYRGGLRSRGTKVSVKETRMRVTRLIKRNAKLFRRLA